MMVCNNSLIKTSCVTVNGRVMARVRLVNLQWAEREWWRGLLLVFMDVSVGGCTRS